jgi:crotonobetainyl-CoA:carnitine CoA-transferase CaiB-like acyl-CoA transferase
VIAIQTQEEWQRFCTNVIDSSDLFDNLAFSNNESRVNNVVGLESILALRLADIDSGVIRSRLKEHLIANAQLNDPVDLWNHEQLVSKGFRMDVDLGDGESTQLFPLLLSFDPSLARQSWIPRLDEHDEDLVQEVLDIGEAVMRAKTAEKGPTAGSGGVVCGS